MDLVKYGCDFGDSLILKEMSGDKDDCKLLGGDCDCKFLSLTEFDPKKLIVSRYAPISWKRDKKIDEILK